MSKRFTDSEKWRDPWFSELPSNLKLLWLYLLDNCDHAGIWKVNGRLAEFETGVASRESLETVPEPFHDRVFSKDGYWFIPKFLKWQYGHELSKGAAVASALQKVESHGFSDCLGRVPRESLDSPWRAKAKAKAMAKAKGEGSGEGSGLLSAAELIAHGLAFPPPPVKKP